MADTTKHLFMPDVDPAERRRILQDNADKVEQGSYFKVLDEEETLVLREELAEVSIKQRQLEQEKKDLIDEWKERHEPVKRRKLELIDNLRSGQEEMEGTLYLVADHDAGDMLYYDSEGVLIKSRRLRPDEKQIKIMNMLRNDKTGTND